MTAPAFAGPFKFKIGDETINAVSNTTVIAGAAVRVESQDKDLIAKGHLDPEVCGRTADGKMHYGTCQGVFRTQSFPAERLAHVRPRDLPMRPASRPATSTRAT